MDGWMDGWMDGEPPPCSVFVVNIICVEFVSCNFFIANTFSG